MSKEQKKKWSILFFKVNLEVALGWEEIERKIKQCVLVEIKITFKTPPLGCETDNLENTYCYDAIIKTIQKKLDFTEFRLLEHLAYSLYDLVKNALSGNELISIRVSKKIPIVNLEGDATFFYGDEEMV